MHSRLLTTILTTSATFLWSFTVCETFSPSSRSSTTTAKPHIGIRPELSKETHAHSSAADAGINIKIASTEKGLGAFATSKIPMGTHVGNYDGELLTIDEVKARFWGKRQCDEDDQSWADSRKERGQAITGNYLLELPNKLFVDAEDADKSGWCRFMNHAEEGEEENNVKAFMQSKIGGEEHTFPRMYTIEDIEIGEELCWDYGGKFFI